jgi:hypothetical protein
VIGFPRQEHDLPKVAPCHDDTLHPNHNRPGHGPHRLKIKLRPDHGRPVLLAATTAESIVAVSALSGIWRRVAWLDPDLRVTQTREIVEASDDERAGGGGLAASSERRFLLCNYPSGAHFLRFVPARNLDPNRVSLAAVRAC